MTHKTMAAKAGRRQARRLPGKPLARLLLATTVLTSPFAAISEAQADFQYWDGSNTTPGGVANGRGGSGVWNGANTNWTNQAGSSNAPWANDGAVFAAVSTPTPTTPATVTVEGARTFTGMTFLAPSANAVTFYDFNAGAGGALITNTPATVFDLQPVGTTGSRFVNALINVEVQGTGGIVKRGGGALEINTANSHTGGTTVGEGRLTVYKTGGLGSGDVTVTDGLLELQSNTPAQNTLGSRILTVGTYGSAAFYSRTDAGSATITNRSAGAVNFLGASGNASNATIINEAGALLNVTPTSYQLKVGSVSGAGNIRLGAQGLTVGSLNLDDTISGIIQDAVGQSGPVGLVKTGTGALTLSGHNTYAGTTLAQQGKLVIDGSIAGAVDVSPAGSLAGSGTIAGLVRVGAGGILEGRSGQTLTMGELRLNSVGGNDSRVNVALGARSNVAVFNVTGALTLDGVLNVSDAGGFANGTYRLFNHGGALTNNGLVIASLPAGHNPGDWSIDTATSGQVNLIAAAGPGEQYWDGPNMTPGSVANGRGGTGTWNAANTNWTNQAGIINAPWAGGTAVFAPQANNPIPRRLRRPSGRIGFKVTW